jgi:hypothetical protein
MVTLKGIITGLKTREGQRRGSVSAKTHLRRLPDPPLYSHRKMSIVRKAVHVLLRAWPFAVFLQWLHAQILPVIARCAGTARTGDGFRELPCLT